MDKNKRDVVVVGGNHYNTLWVARSLGMAGWLPTIIVVAPQTKKSFVVKTKYAKSSYIVASDEAMIDVLRNLQFDSLVPLFSSADHTSDSIDCHYEELKQKYLLPNCGNSQDCLVGWMDKNRMTAMAAECGFRVPFSKEIRFDSVLPDFGDVPYPCILKPLKSSGGKKEDFRICHSQNELTVELNELQKHCAAVLLQEFIKPDFEISILAMRNRKAGIHCIPGLLHKVSTCQDVRNLGMPTYAYVEKDLIPYVEKENVVKFLEILDYCGLYSIEFFVSNGKAYFLEINLRVDGDLFVYTTAGCNMPSLWADITLGVSPNIQDMQLKKKRTYGMTEISYVKYLSWRNPLKIIRDWWNCDCYSIFSWKDPLPFIYKFLYR